MDLYQMVNRLKQQGEAIISLCEGFTPDSARWKPDPDSWSLLEVINHLVDEEVLDFRSHLDHILHTPELPWLEIDPMGWVTLKAYNQRILTDSISCFDEERRNSLSWLTSLKAPDWDSSITFSWGDLSAGDILASWVAHDLLHLRQIIELRYSLTHRENLPFRINYAGRW